MIPRIIFIALVVMISASLGWTWYHKVDTKTALYWWQDRMRGDTRYVLFLGSSSIDRLPEEMLDKCQESVVLGFHNGTIESLETYLIGADLEHAQAIVLYIGENDLAYGEELKITISQFDNLIQRFRLDSSAQIGVMTIKFSPARVASHVDFLGFNRHLEQYATADSSVSLIPFDSIKSSEFFSKDGIHLNARGYSELSTMFNEFCAIHAP